MLPHLPAAPLSSLAINSARALRRLAGGLRSWARGMSRWLAVGLLLLACVTLLASEFFLLRQARLERLQADLRSAALRSVPALTAQGRDPVARDAGRQRAENIVSELMRQPDFLAVALYLEDGRLLAARARPGEAPPPARAEADHAVATPLQTSLHLPVSQDDRAWGQLSARIHFTGLLDHLAVLASSLSLLLLALLALVWRAQAEPRRRAALAEARVRDLETRDPVTGLTNRIHFLARLRDCVAKARSSRQDLALLCVDIDNFKVINDSLGHEAGDHLLRVIGHRLAGVLSGHGDIGRMGGDEYAILAYPCDARRAVELARLCQRTLSLPVQTAGQSVYLGASLGIAMFPEHCADADGLLRCADIALFQAKQSGKGDYRYYAADMAVWAGQRFVVESELRQAMERGELTLHYQPQVDVESLAIVGVEALMRWRSAEHGGFVSNEFIAIAEQSGLINPLGQWALQTACRQARAWQDAGLGDLTVSVNLSAHQFHTTDVAGLVDDALHLSGLQPGHLELELTETILMRNDAEMLDKLAALNDLGVRLAIDDFGTGYSSLAYLKRLPIQRLKIDRSFVRDSHTDPDDAAIATAIIGMARGLGVEVTAEGVENQEQLEFLRRAGCQIVQGYYFGSALPADELETLVRRVRAGTARAETLPGR